MLAENKHKRPQGYGGGAKDRAGAAVNTADTEFLLAGISGQAKLCMSTEIVSEREGKEGKAHHVKPIPASITYVTSTRVILPKKPIALRKRIVEDYVYIEHEDAYENEYKDEWDDDFLTPARTFAPRKKNPKMRFQPKDTFRTIKPPIKRRNGKNKVVPMTIAILTIAVTVVNQDM